MLLDDTIRELKDIMMSLTIKYKNKGEALDTADVKYNANRYISAMDKTDNFFSYPVYDVSSIIKAGVAHNVLDASEYAIDPSLIPEIYRNAVLEAQRKFIIDNYVELNPYFRVLAGKYPLTRDPHFPPMEFYEKYAIEFKPVDEFTNTEVLHLEASGELDKLKEAYPEEEYLNNLGPYAISPYVARKAYNMQILKTNYSKNGDILDKFLTIYENNRSYIMSVVYVQDFATNKPYYDEFMALILAVMTTQRVIVDVFKVGISRDFYDLSMIQALLESYNVPFIETLPLEYQNLLAKNLNMLLHFKSTDKVIVDILNMIGFENSSIMKYYLVKNHRFDAEGNPIFAYETNEAGEVVENRDLMYDVHFVAVDIEEENEEFELSNSKNRVDYNEVAITDPYWWEDDNELLKRIYDDEINYINTKYMHINLMYKLTEMMFEIIHVFKILRDKKSQTSKMKISIPRIISTRKVDLFTFYVFMSALLCKKNNLKGEVITEHSQVLGFVGFNFKNDFNALREYLHANSHLIKSDEIMKYIANIEVVRLEDVDRIFSNIKALWELISKELASTTDKNIFNIYEKLYRTIFVSDFMSEVFTKRNGEIATTFKDMLFDLDPELHSLLDMADDDTMEDYIQHGIEVLDHLVTSAEYLHLMIGNSTVLLEALLKLLRFFKSYTVDIRDFNIIYTLDHPYLHGIKILDYLKGVDVDLTILDEAKLVDYVGIVSEMTEKELIRFKENLEMYGLMDIHTRIIMSDKISVETDMNIRDVFNFMNYVTIDSSLWSQDELRIVDKIENIKGEIKLEEKDFIYLKKYIEGDISVEDNFNTYDDVSLLNLMGLMTKLLIDETTSILAEIGVTHKDIVRDTLHYLIQLAYEDKISLFDSTIITSFISENLKLSEKQTLEFNSKIQVSLDFNIYDKVASMVGIVNEERINFLNIIRTVSAITKSEYIFSADNLRMSSEILKRNKLSIHDGIHGTVPVALIKSENINLINIIMTTTELIKDERLSIDDALNYVIDVDIASKAELSDAISEFKNVIIDILSKHILNDVVSIKSSIQKREVISMRDTITIVRESGDETF